MSTIVCFHAHPDDECIGTGGTMARAAQAGHRVVLVIATRGERGEPTPGVLDEGEMLWERRIVETLESAALLGASRVEFLGYIDSGMMGEPTNDFPYSFWTASVEHAADRLAAILIEEGADILTVYDDNGGYGHPDHIQVHRVGLRAAQKAGTPKVFEGTMNRDHIVRSIEEARAAAAVAGEEPEFEPPEDSEIDRESFGKPESELTHAIDVSDLLGLKRDAMVAHRSQIADDSWFLTMPEEAFASAFGTEWFIETGRTRACGRPDGDQSLDGGVTLDVHVWWAWVVVIGNASAGLWCLGAHWSPALRVRPLWAFVALMEVTIFVQVALGVYLVAVEGIDAPGMHMFYGFISIISVAILYVYRTSIRAWQYLLYGFGGLFLMGLGIRAMVLG